MLSFEEVWKRLQFVALQRSDILIAEYQAEVSMYDSSLWMKLGVTIETQLEGLDTPFVAFLLKVTSLLLEVRGFQQFA